MARHLTRLYSNAPKTRMRGNRIGSGPSEESAMPTYEYRCRECKNVFERVEALADHGHGRPQCPQCKSRQVEQVFTAFFAKTARKA